jgi:hypothetical protein
MLNCKIYTLGSGGGGNLRRETEIRNRQRNRQILHKSSHQSFALWAFSRHENFLRVVSGLPRVINSHFNLSASLLLLHYRRSEPHFPVSMESELLATGPASTLLSTRHLILARARFTWPVSPSISAQTSLLGYPRWMRIWSARFVADQWPVSLLKVGLLLVPACWRMPA